MEQINWKHLTSPEQVDTLKELSGTNAVLIFKHSTRCSISTMALSRLERNYDDCDGKLLPYFIDILSSRDTSNKIAASYHVAHESPQAIVLYQNQIIYMASHNAIDFNAIRKICIEHLSSVN